MNVCEYHDCDNRYEPKTHNQKYCCDECCRLATNERIMERYYERKARRAGKHRVCEAGCGTVLSRYNDERYCASCQNSVGNKSDLYSLAQQLA